MDDPRITHQAHRSTSAEYAAGIERWGVLTEPTEWTAVEAANASKHERCVFAEHAGHRRPISPLLAVFALMLFFYVSAVIVHASRALQESRHRA